jgi:Tfp pilus assembly protein PilO
MARATTGLSYLTFGVVILGSLVFSVFVTIPQFSQYKGVTVQLAQAIEQEKNNKIFLDNLDERAEELKKYEPDAKALSMILPDKFLQSSFWVNINDLATRAGVVVVSIGDSKKEAVKQSAAGSEAVTANSVLAGDDKSVVKEDTLSAQTAKLEKWTTAIQVKGNYSQIRAFIKNLESSLILSDLKELKLTPVASSDKNTVIDMLSADMTIRTYVQP